VCEWFLFKIGEYLAQVYKQERDCLMHCARLANTLLKDEESTSLRFPHGSNALGGPQLKVVQGSILCDPIQPNPSADW